MSRSGRQHEELDSSNRAHVAQLRRLVLLLLVWSFFMTLGVAVSISLQFVLPRPPNKEVTVQGKSNHPEIMMYDFSESTRPSDDGSFELKWKNVTGNVKVEVQEDGNYFLYLQVVLQDPSPNVTYTVRFLYETVESTKPERILERHINGSLSTGFMGKGFPLPGGTSLKVTCKPAVNLNKANTYMGIIKFS